MIKILGISGSPVKGGNTVTLLKDCFSHIENHDSVRTEIITLANKRFDGCKHCNWCVKNQSEGKFCIQEDDMNMIYFHFLDAQGIILATPVHLGRLSGLMANMIDRLRVFVHESGISLARILAERVLELAKIVKAGEMALQV